MKFSKKEYRNMLVDLVNSCERKYGFLTTSLLTTECISCIYNFNKEDYNLVLGLSVLVLRDLEVAGVIRNNGSVYQLVMGFEPNKFYDKEDKENEEELGA